LNYEKIDLQLKEPFGISRGTSTVSPSVFVHIGEGVGEASPSGYVGESVDTVSALLDKYKPLIPDEPDGILHFMDKLNEEVEGNPAFKVSISMALWDALGKKLNAPMYKILGLSAKKAPQSTFTIGIASKEDMVRKVREAEEYPILKIKVGMEGDVEIIRAIHEVTDKILRVDANGGWTPDEAIRKIDEMADLGVDFIEQPCVKEDLEGLAKVHKNSKLPIYVDETVLTRHDVPKVAGKCDGVNLKLMKCGGIGEALAIINTARAHDLGVMIGCMISSSVALTAAAHLTPLVDHADLDGHLLISNDPYEGMTLKDGWIQIPDRPGLGVIPRAGQRLLARGSARTR